MNEVEKALVPKREHWKGMIDEWLSSGSTQKEFCDLKGLSVGTFQYWRRRLAVSQASQRMGFVALKHSPPETVNGGVRVRLPNGIEFYFGGDFSEVVALLEWYEGRSC